MAFVSSVAGICNNTSETMNIVSILTASLFLFVVIGTLSKTVDRISEKFNMEIPIGEYYLQIVFTLEP